MMITMTVVVPITMGEIITSLITLTMILGQWISHGKIPHLVVRNSPAVVRVEGHEMPKCYIIVIYIVPRVGTCCSVNHRNILPNFFSSSWISSTINGRVDSKRLFPPPNTTYPSISASYRN